MVAVRLPFRFDSLSVVPKQRRIVAVSVAAAILLGGVACGLLAPRRAEASTPAAVALKPPGWIVATRSSGAFDLPARDLDGQDFSYTVRRHPAGGGRQDVMAWSAPSGSQLKVVIYRPGREDGVALNPEQAVRQLGTAAGLTLGSDTAGGRLATKFGELPLLEAALAGAEGHCLAVGDLFPGSGVTIAAFACSASAEVIDRKRLACWLDRLTLLSAGGSDAMAAFFARAELQRTESCGATASRPAAVPSRPDWFSAQTPGLRGRLALR